MNHAVEKQVFYRRVAWVSTGHVALLLLFLIVPLIGARFREAAPTIVPIEFVVDTRTLKGEPDEGDGNEEVAEPEPPPPAATPKPRTPEPAPAPTPKVVEAAKPKVVDTAKLAKPADGTSATKTKVQVSKKKMRRPGHTLNPLTPEEIRSRLLLGAQAGTYNTAIPSEDERSMLLIRQAMDRVWVQPSRDTVGNRTVTASFRLGPGGSVSERELVRGSGIPEFDRSVEAALNAVDRIPGLSVSFLERHRVLTIEFVVK
ncbi:MAG: TonB C-terminal domain-containing protein [Lentisphaerae bacterium]|nr:TonB C-terminal domain-containing protein [Lentisphaerota bacterium]